MEKKSEFKAYNIKKSRHGHDNDVLDENQPKGGWEKDETQEHAAQRESWEEAGIIGTIVNKIGLFPEYTKKQKRLKAHHWVFEMHIDQVAKEFPEKKKRERRWFTLQEALVATKKHPYIQQALLESSMNQSPVVDLIENKSIMDQRSFLVESFKTLLIKDV